MTRRTRQQANRLLVAGVVGFIIGVMVTVALGPASFRGEQLLADNNARDGSQEIVVRPSKKESPPAVSPPATPPDAVPAIAVDPVEDQRKRHLTLPVEGIKREELRDTFNEMRGGARRHEALDVLAPRNTPVMAVEDGTIARLFLSKAGGITIYQFDPTETYVYYYAHLERYADGLDEKDRVKRGQVIGYVGTTGNAPRDTPHLHFAIFKMTPEKKWWEGTAIDPYEVLK